MTFRNLGSLTASIVARHAAQRAQLQEAHEQAATFHEAIAEAIQADSDLEEIKQDLRTNSFRSEFAGHDDELRRLEGRYSGALGKAAVALQKMPVKWAAILSCELDRIQSNVVALRPAAE